MKRTTHRRARWTLAVVMAAAMAVGVGPALAADADGDGVEDGVDLCPGTALPENVPTEALGNKRFVLDETTSDPIEFKSPGSRKSFNILETAGCGCGQIIAALGLSPKVNRIGCSANHIQRFVKGRALKRLLATGQATAFQADKNNGAGLDDVDDDGTLRRGLPLTYSSSPTVFDPNTGLEWEKKDDNNVGGLHDKDLTFLWSGDGSEETIWDWLDDLNNTCANDETVGCSTNGDADCAVAGGLCGFDGHRDWRIPNLRELHSIVDLGRFGPSIDPAFNTDCVAPCALPDCSCTEANVYWSSSTRFIDAGDGWTVDFTNGTADTFDKGDSHYVRAVRGGR